VPAPLTNDIGGITENDICSKATFPITKEMGITNMLLFILFLLLLLI
jgi:hypothetical protein